MTFMFGWVIAAILGGLTAVRVGEFLLGGLSSGVLNILRPIFFVGTVTAVTTHSQMSRFTSKVRKALRIITAVRDRVESIPDTERKHK